MTYVQRFKNITITHDMAKNIKPRNIINYSIYINTISQINFVFNIN